jgi:hypothetical protein
VSKEKNSPAMKEGDLLGLLIDPKEKKISWFRNRNLIGSVAYQILPAEQFKGEATVGNYHPGHANSLANTIEFPKKTKVRIVLNFNAIKADLF